MTIKPHSSFKTYFNKDEYVVGLDTYYDLIFYLNGMHKSFINYVRKQQQRGVDEGFVFLDKNLREITPDQLKFKKARSGDVVHIVPAIFGGGGKRGGLLSVLAIAAFAFVALPAMAAAAGAGASAPVGASVSAAGGILGSGSFLTNIAVNVGLSLLSSLFMSAPAKEEQARQNNMFGSLVNTTESGTPIALHYGMVRVAGQMINGHVYTAKHGKTETLSVYGAIIKDEGATPGSEQQAELLTYLKGFNQYD